MADIIFSITGLSEHIETDLPVGGSISDSANVTFTAKSGYLLKGDTYGQWSNDEGDMVNWSIPQDQKTFILTPTMTNPSSGAYRGDYVLSTPPAFVASAPVIPDFTINLKLGAHVTSSPTGRKIKESENIVITADSGYILKSGLYKFWVGSQGDYINFTIPHNATAYTLKPSEVFSSYGGKFTEDLALHTGITAEAVAVDIAVNLGNMEHYTSNVINGRIGVSVPIVFNAESGYKFIAQDVKLMDSQTDLWITTISEGTTFTIDPAILLQSEGGKFKLDLTLQRAIVTAQDSVGSVEYINQYNLTQAQLKAFSSDLYKVGTDGQIAEASLINFVNNIFLLPFNVDVIKGGETGVIIGWNTRQTKGFKLLNDNLTIDLGSIQIPLKYNNAYDFKNVECLLNLPFLDTEIILDARYCIGQTLKMELFLDMYTGLGIVEIKSTFSGEQVINFVEVDYSYKFPIYSENKTGKTFSIEGKKPTRLLQAILKVNRLNVYDTGSKARQMKENRVINTLSGLTRINNFEIVNSEILDIERELLRSVFLNGVYL